MKADLICLFSALHGKICPDDNMTARQMYGNTIVYKHGNITVEATEQQTAARNKFKNAQEATKAILADTTTDEYLAYVKAFKNQRKYVTLRGYIFAQVYAAA